jgi:hypothetical protein
MLKNQYSPLVSHCRTGEIPSSLSMVAVKKEVLLINSISLADDFVETVIVGQETSMWYVDGNPNSGYPRPESSGPKGKI